MQPPSRPSILGYPATLTGPFSWPTEEEFDAEVRLFDDLVDLLELLGREEVANVVVQNVNAFPLALKICRLVRQHSKARIRLVTAGDDADESAAKAVGVTSLHHVQNGYDELLTLVRPTNGPVRPKNIEIGTLRIDTARRKVAVAGNVLQLTKTEYEVLLRLAETPGETVVRGDLIRHLWGDYWFGAANVLDTHLTHLRKKMRDAGHEKAVITVRGVGLYFEAQISELDRLIAEPHDPTPSADFVARQSNDR